LLISQSVAEWLNTLLDADKVWSAFLEGCVTAGPEGCPLFAPTSAEIQAKVDKLYASLRARPIPVRTETSHGLVDYGTMRQTIFTALYTPYATFRTLAQALADLSAGNATALYKMAESPPFKCSCDPSEGPFPNMSDGGTAVYCNDVKQLSDKYEDVQRHYRSLQGTSSWADMWASARATCM
jgi:hypothetical protein